MLINSLGESFKKLISKYDMKADNADADDAESGHKNDGPLLGDIFPFDADLYYRRGDDLFESRANSRGDDKGNEESPTDSNGEISSVPEIPTEAPAIPEIVPPPVPSFADVAKVNNVFVIAHCAK